MIDRIIMGILMLVAAFRGISTLMRVLSRLGLSLMLAITGAGFLLMILAFIMQLAGFPEAFWSGNLYLTVSGVVIAIVTWKAFWMLEDHNPILGKLRATW